MSKASVPPFDSLPRATRHWSAARPDREAAILDDLRLTYAELASRTELLSNALLASGIAPGDRVAMLTGPHPEFLVAMLAATDIGAVWVGMHPRYRRPEMAHVIAESTPKVLIAFAEIDGRDYREDLEALRVAHPCIERVILLGVEASDPDGLDAFVAGAKPDPDALASARASVTPDDTAVIIFTSGTTGSPKGAMITHRALMTGARTQATHWPVEDMRLLQNMPPNHIACLGMSTAQALVTGGAIVFINRFEPSRVLDTIERERINFIMHSPAVYHMLVNEPGFHARDLSSVEYWLWAGAPMPMSLVEQMHGLGARLGTAFGMTELGAYVTYSEPNAPFDVLAGSVGRPEPGYELRLADAAGRPVERGDDGEIQARGDWLLNGYMNRPEETREAYTPDGWFRTGDVAVEREDGNWTLVGRLKEMFKSGGFNVYPREVEIAIEAHPDVAMAAVLGVPDTKWHEVGHAFVQPVPGTALDGAELDAWCRDRLANYKIPKRFEVTELPRLPIGKIDKQALRRKLAERADPD